MPDEATPVRDAASALDALRERGVDRRDPVRFRVAESLARRAAAHAGATRRSIDARVAVLLERLAAVIDAPAEPAVPRAPRGLLAELVAQAAGAKSAPLLAPSARPRDASPGKTAAAPAADPKTLQYFQRTWSRLSAAQRLAQSRAAMPDNAGPLNSQHLVHRSLTLMQSLSPEYLERFVAHVDALQWLEQANEAAAQELVNATRPAGAKRSLPARR